MSQSNTKFSKLHFTEGLYSRPKGEFLTTSWERKGYNFWDWAEVTFKVWLTYGLQPKLWKCQPLSSCVHLKILINNLFDFIQAIIFFIFLYFHSQVSIQAANRQWTNKNTKKSCEFKERLIKACEVSMLLSYIIFYFAFHVPTGNPCVPSWKFKIRFSVHFCVILC